MKRNNSSYCYLQLVLHCRKKLSMNATLLDSMIAYTMTFLLAVCSSSQCLPLVTCAVLFFMAGCAKHQDLFSCALQLSRVSCSPLHPSLSLLRSPTCNGQFGARALQPVCKKACCATSQSTADRGGGSEQAPNQTAKHVCDQKPTHLIRLNPEVSQE